ncbi:MAG: hypothetical protein ABH884_02870, partial [Candidatus Komeilibacteria bacterium]
TSNHYLDGWVSLIDEPQNNVGGRATLEIRIGNSSEYPTIESEIISKDVDILAFMCNNPWPLPEEFPYQDEERDDCLPDTDGDGFGDTYCPNTNFEVYYCMDRGEDGTEDDLPMISTDTVVYTPNNLDTPNINEWKKEFLLQRGDESSDAVGIRVLANDDHFSPLLWYRKTFDPAEQGNPQSLIVDGYQAIREGRTVYTNAVNIEDAPDDIKLYSDIYLISYNEGADSDTTNIYNQMVKYMKFNAGLVTEGGLVDLGICGDNVDNICKIDSDCSGEICTSNKAKLTRDTKRLSDIQDANWLLDNYHNNKRCSNDQSLVCLDNDDDGFDDSGTCYGSATCDNYYPNLSAGTYVTGVSLSVWPSWQATLGNILGSALPVDPINKLYGCEDPFDETTCWNDVDKEMRCPTSLNIYGYFSDNNGSGMGIYTTKEYSTGNWQPDWPNVEADPFRIDLNLISPICTQ